MRSLWQRTSVKVLAVSLIVFFVAVGLLAIPVLNPTITYQGRTLSIQEFRGLAEQDKPLACGQVPGGIYDQIGFTVAYACFDTQAEVDAYMREAWQ